MKRIVLSHEFVNELEELFDILVERGFFSYDEYALKYMTLNCLSNLLFIHTLSEKHLLYLLNTEQI